MAIRQVTDVVGIDQFFNTTNKRPAKNMQADTTVVVKLPFMDILLLKRK
jgi:hypothetical protein